MTGERQRVASSICLFAFSLIAAIAGAADEPQEVITEAIAKSPDAVAEATQDAYTETGVGAEDVPCEAEQRELGSNEDPMATERARREVERQELPEEIEQRRSGFDIYGSARIHYRERFVLPELG